MLSTEDTQSLRRSCNIRRQTVREFTRFHVFFNARVGCWRLEQRIFFVVAESPLHFITHTHTREIRRLGGHVMRAMHATQTMLTHTHETQAHV